MLNVQHNLNTKEACQPPAEMFSIVCKLFQSEKFHYFQQSVGRCRYFVISGLITDPLPVQADVVLM